MHWSSDRRPFQVTGTSTGTALRTTTSRSWIVCGQSWLDQIRSSPEAIFTTRDSEATLKVHAGWVPDSSSRMTIGPPAQACGTVGRTLMSSSRHSPLAGARGALDRRRIFSEGATGPNVTEADGACCSAEVVLALIDVGVVFACASDEPGDAEDEQQGDAEHDASAYPVDALGQSPARLPH